MSRAWSRPDGGRHWGLRLSWMLWLALGAGCTNPTGEVPVERHNRVQFNDEVYPVLLRDCAFPECHGSSDRIFRVYGPGRVRLSNSDTPPSPFDKATTTEIGRTFELTMAHRNPEDPGLSLLLRKPLAVEAGGTGHRGVDRYGRDVYRTAEDLGYRALLRWATSTEEGQP